MQDAVTIPPSRAAIGRNLRRTFSPLSVLAVVSSQGMQTGFPFIRMLVEFAQP